MKTLPPIHGLLHQMRVNRRQAAREAIAAKSQTKCPRTAHESGEMADRMAKEADALEKWAEEDVDLCVQLNATGDFLRFSKNTSPLRTLALRKIEEAEMILRREIGDDPGELKP